MEPSDNFFNEILSVGPSQATLFLILSKIKEQGLFEKVIEEGAKALKTYPDDIRIMKLRAEAFLSRGRLPEAEAEIIAAISKINELNASYRLLADVYIAQGKTVEAVEALKLYLIHCPDDKESYDLLESLTPTEGIQEAVPEAPSALEAIAPQPLETEFPDIATPTLAEVFYNQGRIREAIETYQKVVERNPEDPAILNRLEELRNAMQQAETAEMKKSAIILKKKKMASILEGWLTGIREQSVSTG